MISEAPCLPRPINFLAWPALQRSHRAAVAARSPHTHGLPEKAQPRAPSHRSHQHGRWCSRRYSGYATTPDRASPPETCGSEVPHRHAEHCGRRTQESADRDSSSKAVDVVVGMAAQQAWRLRCESRHREKRRAASFRKLREGSRRIPVWKTAEVVVESKWTKIICVDSWNEPQLHASAKHLRSSALI